MEAIKEVGANWVTTHPYAGISKDGSLRFRENDFEKPPQHWTRPIEEAHAKGLKICIKPHLAHWRTGFSWRGDITFNSGEEWERFWMNYKKWIVRVAAACKNADGFVVGTELDKTIHFEDKWREIIAEIRKVTNANLTYAVNWTDYKNVKFWDALDVIGIQAYFPLSDNQNPTETELRQAWAKHMKELHTYAKSQNRKILFTELGYNQSLLAAKMPWDSHSDGVEAQPLQEACWRTAFDAIEKESVVVGAMLWKWFPYPRPTGRNFVLATPRIKKILQEYWLP
jgi:hypothetical protein